MFRAYVKGKFPKFSRTENALSLIPHFCLAHTLFPFLLQKERNLISNIICLNYFILKELNSHLRACFLNDAFLSSELHVLDALYEMR